MKKVGKWLYRYLLTPMGYFAVIILAIVFCLLCGVASVFYEVFKDTVIDPIKREKLVRQLTAARSEPELVAALKALEDTIGYCWISGLDQTMTTLRWGVLGQLAVLRRKYLPKTLASASTVEECRRIHGLCYLTSDTNLLDDIGQLALDKMLSCLEIDLALASSVEELKLVRRWAEYHHSPPWKKLQKQCSSKLKEARQRVRCQAFPLPVT